MKLRALQNPSLSYSESVWETQYELRIIEGLHQICVYYTRYNMYITDIGPISRIYLHSNYRIRIRIRIWIRILLFQKASTCYNYVIRSLINFINIIIILDSD